METMHLTHVRVCAVNGNDALDARARVCVVCVRVGVCCFVSLLLQDLADPAISDFEAKIGAQPEASVAPISHAIWVCSQTFAAGKYVLQCVRCCGLLRLPFMHDVVWGVGGEVQAV
jgi:hypothetical protein